MSSGCWGWDWEVVNPELSHQTRITPDSMTTFVCSSNMRLHFSDFLSVVKSQNKTLRIDDQPAAAWPCCVPHCLFFFFMWPGHKNQSADYKLCRSMCSSVREAQCFSLDLALAKLALLQSPLRTRLCSKGAAALLWLRGGGAGRSCSFVIYLLNAVWLLLYLPVQHSEHWARLWGFKDTILSTRASFLRSRPGSFSCCMSERLFSNPEYSRKQDYCLSCTSANLN